MGAVRARDGGVTAAGGGEIIVGQRLMSNFVGLSFEHRRLLFREQHERCSDCQPLGATHLTVTVLFLVEITGWVPLGQTTVVDPRSPPLADARSSSVSAS